MSVPHRQELLLLSRWWKLLPLLLSYLLKVTLYLWPSDLDRHQLPWRLHAAWVQQHNCLQNGTFLLFSPPLLLLSFTKFDWCCLTESASVISVFEFFVSVDVTFVWTSWLHSPFELEYLNHYCLLTERHWQDPIPFVLQYLLIKNLHLPQFFSNILQFLKNSAKMWFECIPIFVSCIFVILLSKAYLVSFSFIDSFIRQVDILLVGVGIESCGSDISQFFNVVEKLLIIFSTLKVICLTTSSRWLSIWGVIFS